VFDWPAVQLEGGSLSVAPILYEGTFSEEEISASLANLRDYGSVAAPGFKDPEGICIYHTQTRTIMKVTLDNNDAGKWETAA
jgi:hypothetical protein